jgi:succinyl-CoA synthetase alpha subunit
MFNAVAMVKKETKATASVIYALASLAANAIFWKL